MADRHSGNGPQAELGIAEGSRPAGCQNGNMMKPANLVIIMGDELSTKSVGAYGHPFVKTPNIDALARSGTRFTNAYTNSPLCMPARAAFATGRQPHETGYWDNVFAYDGRIPSWGHALQATGHHFTTIGKLHYIDEAAPTGIDEQILPMHLFDGGDIWGLIRDDPPMRPQSKTLAGEVGVGDSGYTRYDRQITDLAEDWLAGKAARPDDKPWVLFVSYIAPHFPLIVPQRYLDLYRDIDIPEPKQRLAGEPEHPWFTAFRNCYCFDDFFKDAAERREAIRTYYALCSFLDDNVGRVVSAIRQSGLAETTRIAFLADHGDNLGARGLWGKSTMYEESAKVPLILSGPDVAAGAVCATPVSLADFYPTVLDCVGAKHPLPATILPLKSLFGIAAAADDDERMIFGEYHASCAMSGALMLRRGEYKYIHYVGLKPELFDLSEDPEELRNLALEPEFDALCAAFDQALRRLVDPEAIDRAAKASQAHRLQELGGREAIISKGGVPHTPAPGEKPAWIG